MGKFQLKPKAGSNYYIALYGVNKNDTLYKLPAAITQGPVISLQRAVVNDTLIVNLRDEQHEKLYLIGHNYKQLFFTMPVIMTASDKTIEIKLNDIPKGLTQLTVTDSMGRPFAERIFFAHYDRKIPLSITTDKNEYPTRGKVNVKVKLNGKPDSGFVSIACVQENRVEIKKKNNIESYLYLKHDLEGLPIKENYLGNTESDKQYLENMLLVKGWRKYTWTDLLKTKATDTLHSFDNITFRGSVTKFGDSLRNAVTAINLNMPLNPITTGKAGNFMLKDDDLITESNKKVSFKVSGNSIKNYKIYLLDPYIEINEKLAAHFKPDDYSNVARANTQYMQLADNEKTVLLEEVKINDNKDGFFLCKRVWRLCM